MNTFPERDSLSLLVTDSGLGGLSIVADIVARLKRHRHFKSMKLTYFNAWPEQDRGYHGLSGPAERIRVFNRALIGMDPFKPDLIMIACNTLSAIYPQTEFSRQAAMPVVGIIDLGVLMIYRELIARPASRVIILGTPITIAANAHQAGLLNKGIRAERIIPQACDQLAGEIEKDPGSKAVKDLIDRYVREAAHQAGDTSRPVAAAFCCTHYGYSQEIFRKKLETYFSGPAIILNPNRAMSAYLFPDDRPPGHSSVQIDLDVVSRITLSVEKIAAISKLLNAVSPETAEALRHYRHIPDLFTF